MDFIGDDGESFAFRTVRSSMDSSSNASESYDINDGTESIDIS